MKNQTMSRRGRDAESPWQIPLAGWKDVGIRVFHEFSDDRVLLIAAGATFFLLLALFPALAAFVSIYGVVSDPQTLAEHIAFLGGLLPTAGVEIIEGQLRNLINKDPASLSVGFFVGLALAIWGANSGIKTLFTAMNVAYDEDEKRGFIRFHLTTLLFTFGALAIGVVLIVSVGVVPAILEFAGLGETTEWFLSLIRWPVMLVSCWCGISLIYRYGPSRSRAEWRWILPGSLASTVVWILASMVFSIYLREFADYNATYGSLGAVVGFMMWTWISTIILILGAELNSEAEHQTRKDSTTGPDKPMGERGAVMADTLGKRAGQ